MKARIMMFVVFLALLVPGFMPAQQLPVGDPRNASFSTRFQEIVLLNAGHITDYHKMTPGTEYQLPEGGTDVLRIGDNHGIWGREFRKTYGISYDEYMRSQEVPPPVIPSPAPVDTVKQVAAPATAAQAGTPSSWWWWLLAVLVITVFLISIYSLFARALQLERRLLNNLSRERDEQEAALQRERERLIASLEREARAAQEHAAVYREFLEGLPLSMNMLGTSTAAGIGPSRILIKGDNNTVAIGEQSFTSSVFEPEAREEESSDVFGTTPARSAALD